MFGPNWPASLEYKRLQYTFSGCFQSPAGHCVPTTVTHIAPDGTTNVYTYTGWTDDGGVYTYSNNGADASGTLTWIYGSYWLLQQGKINYKYNNTGYLLSINDYFGAGTTTVAYDTLRRITRVTKSGGKYVEFTWGSNNRVSSVRDPAGNNWTYLYNSGGMLTSVTSPGQNPDVRTYHYEGADPTLLTGISINGVRQTRYTYQADRRVQTSGLDNGEELDSFTYEANRTTVTNARGQTTSYDFVPVGSSRLLSKSTRNATSSCPLAVAQIFYDSNGYINYTIDWNGVITDFTYDSSGKLLRITKAWDTAIASIRENSWNGSNLVEQRAINSSGVTYSRLTYTYYTDVDGAFNSGRLKSTVVTDVAAGTVRTVSHSYSFSPSGALTAYTLTVVLPAGNAVTTMAFDAMGNVTSHTNALGHQTTFSLHDGLGRPGRMVAPRRFVWNSSLA